MGWLNSLSDSERWAYGLVATFVFAMLGIFITQRLALRRAPQRGGGFPHVHYWGPGIVTSYGPRHKNRFIKSLTSGEYMFAIGTVDVPQADFFKRYDVSAVSVLGVPDR